MSDLKGFVIENGVLEKYTGSETEVIVPESVTGIGSNAFGWCGTLTKVVLPDCVKSIDLNAFRYCNNLTDITLPEGITCIKSRTFEGCRSLSNITLPKSLTSIGDGAFYGCSGLASIIIPEGVTSIENETFYGCSSLTSITLPKGVTHIGEYAFEGCTMLSGTISLADLQEIASGAFKGCTAMCFSLPGKLTETKDSLSGELARGSIETTDAGFAHLFLFQSSPLWKAWKNASDIKQPAVVFGQMLSLLRNTEKPDAKLGKPIADYIVRFRTKLPREKIQEMLTLFSNVKSKEISALQKDASLQDYLAGKEESSNPAEESAAVLLDRIGPDPAVEKAISKGIHYRDSNAVCSREVLIAIISYYAKEWKRCAESLAGEIGTTEVLQDASKIRIDPDVDQMASALDPKELSAFLEKRIAGSTYRPFLLAWARYADEESVKTKTATYRTLLRGRSQEHYFAKNMAEALIISPTQAAMLFFDNNDLLERFALCRGTSATELRDTVMLPDFGFDPSGAKLFDIGGDIIEVRLTDQMGFEMFDREKGKVIRSFPKNSSDPDKAQAASEEYKSFKKQVLGFAKLRTEQLLKMHQSGESVKPEIWKKVYLDHPVIKLLARHVVWKDETGKTFIVNDDSFADAAQASMQPEGSIRVAHVLDLNADEIGMWQHTLTKIGRAQLFEQLWEPVLVWDQTTLADRYDGFTISSKARDDVKAQLKHRGIEVHAGEMDREFDASGWGYTFSQENTVYFSKSLCLDYSVDAASRDITFRKASLGAQPLDRELNAVLLELDKAVTLERVKKDDINVMGILDQFTLAQISRFISAAQDAGASNLLAQLIDYKNTHFADYDPMDEFTLEW